MALPGPCMRSGSTLEGLCVRCAPCETSASCITFLWVKVCGYVWVYVCGYVCVLVVLVWLHIVRFSFNKQAKSVKNVTNT